MKLLIYAWFKYNLTHNVLPYDVLHYIALHNTQSGMQFTKSKFPENVLVKSISYSFIQHKIT